MSWETAIPSLFGMGLGIGQQERDFNFNKKLASHSAELSEGLANHNFDLAMKGHQQTMEQQLKFMEKEGLNKGLMYKQGGHGS